MYPYLWCNCTVIQLINGLKEGKNFKKKESDVRMMLTGMHVGMLASGHWLKKQWNKQCDGTIQQSLPATGRDYCGSITLLGHFVLSTCSTHILIHPPPTFNYQLCMATSPFFNTQFESNSNSTYTLLFIMHTLLVQLCLHNMHITKKDINKDKNFLKKKVI